MKSLFVFPILLGLLIPYQTTNSPDENSPLAVVNFKWSRARRNIAAQADEGTIPARAMIPQNRNFARNARINDPAGVSDPNADTLDGRSARKGWSLAEVKASYERVLREQWTPGTCKGL